MASGLMSGRDIWIWSGFAVAAAADAALCWHAQAWNNFGPTLSGVATLLGATMAVRGFERWQDKALKEQQAKVAAEFLLAALELSNLLGTINAKSLSGGEDTAPHEHAERLIDDIWKAQEPLKEPRAQAEVYLDCAANCALRELVVMAFKVNGLVYDLKQDCDRYGQWGDEGKRLAAEINESVLPLADLEKRLKKTLRRYVHFK